MAVHFWPAFTVISVTSCLTNSSNSGVPEVASGPSTEQLSESASALKRTEFATTAGWVRSLRAVAAEPVKKTRSWPAEAVEEAGSTAGQQLHRPLGQQARLDDPSERQAR